jgi:outer membrane protein assembly factor BamD (BamD/ComL family)
MPEKSKVIFGNPMKESTYKKAVKSKKKYAKKFGDDSNISYPTYIRKNQYIGDSLGVMNICLADRDETVENTQHILWVMCHTGWILIHTSRRPVPR